MREPVTDGAICGVEALFAALHRAALARPVVDGLAPPALDRVVLAGNHLALRDGPRCSVKRPVSAQENVVPVAPADVCPLHGRHSSSVARILELEADPLLDLRAVFDIVFSKFHAPHSEGDVVVTLHAPVRGAFD